MMALPATAFAQASKVYVTPSGTAVGNCPAGTSSAPNLTPAGFNNAGNWGAGTGKIGAGTTVLVCGTFSEPANSGALLLLQGGGSSGNPVTILLDSTLNISAPNWTNSIIASGGGYSNWIVDGGSARTSIIQATLDGTPGEPCPGGTCQYQTSGGCVGSGSGGSNITIQNVTCANMYVNYCPSGNESLCTDTNQYGTCIYFGEVGSNILIQNNVCHDTNDALAVGSNGSAAISSIQWIGNTVYHACTGIQYSGNQTAGGSVTGLVIKGNNIYDGFNWANNGNTCHVDGMHLWVNVGGVTMTRTQIYDNWIHGSWGNGVNAFIFVEQQGKYSDGAPWAGTEVFNNILEDDSTIGHNGDGGIAISGNNNIVANNTCNGISPCIMWWNANLSAWNNIFYNVYTAYLPQASSGATIATINNNNYSGITNWDSANGGNYPTLASWQSACSCDSLSSVGNPNLSSGSPTLPLATQVPTNYLPSASSALLIRQGANLTSLGVASLDSDYLGDARPGSGVCSALGNASCWDIGAYSFASANGAVLPPTSLIATIE